MFNETPSISGSENKKTPEESVKEIEDDDEVVKDNEKGEGMERGRTQPQKKTFMSRVYDAMFGDDEFKEREEFRRMREEQREQQPDYGEREPSVEKQQSEESDKSSYEC